jgi:hypothetical protein
VLGALPGAGAAGECIRNRTKRARELSGCALLRILDPAMARCAPRGFCRRGGMADAEDLKSSARRYIPVLSIPGAIDTSDDSRREPVGSLPTPSPPGRVELDRDLALVVASWPDLADALKAGIMAMVVAATQARAAPAGVRDKLHKRQKGGAR